MDPVTAVARRVLARRGEHSGPLPVAICGAQGSGKSTLTWLLQQHLQEAHGLRVASLSLDDLYMTRAQRAELGARVHPELATRGLPGTHDLPLAESVFDRLLGTASGTVALPRFDKAADDRVPEAEFTTVATPLDVVLLEGWCVGARPQPAEALATPVNDFERDRDPDGRLRAYHQSQLQGPYAALWDRFALLVMLKAPDMDCVVRWRTEQEHALRRRLLAQDRPDTALTDDQVADFVARFERVTRHMLHEMPGRADIVVQLDRDHRVVDTVVRDGAAQ